MGNGLIKSETSEKAGKKFFLKTSRTKMAISDLLQVSQIFFVFCDTFSKSDIAISVREVFEKFFFSSSFGGFRLFIKPLSNFYWLIFLRIFKLSQVFFVAILPILAYTKSWKALILSLKNYYKYKYKYIYIVKIFQLQICSAKNTEWQIERPCLIL